MPDDAKAQDEARAKAKATGETKAGAAPDRGRWQTGPEGIEQAGTVGEYEDNTTPEQRARNAEAARIRDESLALARKLAAGGEHEDDDEAEAEGAADA